jgi:hypothetical protein
MDGQTFLKIIEDIDQTFDQYQKGILVNKLKKYKEENIELKLIIIKLSSRIAELERNNRYIK